MRTCGHSGITLLSCAVCAAAALLAGCTGEWPEGDYPSGALLGTSTTHTHRQTDIYVAPGTRFSVTKSKPVVLPEPLYTYYDDDLDRHVAVLRDGRKFVIVGFGPPVMGVAEHTFSVEGPPDAPGRVHEETTGTYRRSGGAVIYRKR